MGEGLPGSVTTSPGTLTRTEALTEIARFCLLDTAHTDVAAAAESCLQRAIDKYNTRVWYWNLTSQDITFTTGTSVYDLASAFKAPRQFELLDSSSNPKEVLGWMDPRTFGVKFPDRSTSGDPVYYTAMNPRLTGQVTLDAPPGSAWTTKYPTGRLRYFKRIAYPTGSEPLDAPSEVGSGLLWYARGCMAAIHAPDKMGIAERYHEDLWTLEIRDDVRNFNVSTWSD